MHAFKTFLVASALAVAAVFYLRAADTAEESKLREALRKAQATSGEQQVSAPAANETAPATRPAAVPITSSGDNDAALREALRKAQAGSNGQQLPAPAARPTPAVTEAPTAVQAPISSADDAALREALRKAETGANQERTTMAPVTAPTTKPEPVVVRTTPASVSQPVFSSPRTESYSPVPPSNSNNDALRNALRQDTGTSSTTSAQTVAPATSGMAMPAGTFSEVPNPNENDETLRTALRQKMSEPEPTPVAAKPAMSMSRGMANTAPSGFAPLPKPELPISSSKEGRLSELLKLYKDNAITPAQYHEQRAAILAEP